MSNNNKTPAIRFKGFTDTWEQRKLGDIVTVYDGVHQTPNYQTSGIMFLSVENIATLKSNKFISIEDFKRDYKVYPQRNDILMTRIGDVGTTNVVTDNDVKAYYVSLALLKYKGTNPFFLSSAIQSDFVQKGLSNRTLKTAIPMKINKDEIGKVDVMLPTSADEQDKIGSFFSHLDTLITLHQRKCDKLIQFKAAKLQKMFPQNGANKPEIRFRGFTDAWEQRELGELMEITSVKRIHQSDWTDSGVRFLRARDIVAVSKNEEVSEPLFISQEKYDEYSALSGKVKIGDLLVTGVGTIGVPMLINNEEPLYFKDGNIIWFKNEDIIDGEFFYHSFNGSFIQNFIKESAGIGTVGTYTIESGKKTPILLPTQKDEQQKIGTFFSQLDTLITLHQRKCDKYKSIKSGLIRKLFP